MKITKKELKEFKLLVTVTGVNGHQDSLLLTDFTNNKEAMELLIALNKYQEKHGVFEPPYTF